MQSPMATPRAAAAQRRRAARGAGLLALAAVPLLTLRPGHPESETFVAEAPGLLFHRAQGARSTPNLPRTIRHAETDVETEGLPKGIPDSTPDREDPGDEPTSVKDKGTQGIKKPMMTGNVGEWSEEQQFEHVKAKTKWLKSLKGKFVPRGPKPWDEPRFRKVHVQAIIDAKQASNRKIYNQLEEELRRITGLKPFMVKARKNDAKSGIRQGMPVGAAVTMHGRTMMDFLTRLNTIVLPRIRDFEGLWPNSFNNMGHYFFTVNGQEPFRELDDMLDEREISHDFGIGIIMNRHTQPDGMKLMKEFGFPFTDELKPKYEKAEADFPKKGRGKSGDPRR